MKICTMCGNQLSDSANFCSRCGTCVSNGYIPPEQKRKKPGVPVLLIILICVVLVVAIVFGAILGIRSLIDDNVSRNESSSRTEYREDRDDDRDKDRDNDRDEESAAVDVTPPQFPDVIMPVITENVRLSVVAAMYGSQSAAWWADFETDFEAAHQNVDLVVDVVSWNDIYTVVNTRIANGDAPDILNIDVFADYQADGLLLPVQAYMSDETYSKFYRLFLSQSVVDGTVWAVPDLASARALYYNADILAAAGVEVPTTWYELLVACETIKAYDPSIYPWGVDMTTDEGQACFAYYTMNNGGGFVDANGNWDLNSAENVEAVEFIVGMVQAGLTNTDPTAETRYDLQEMFASGKVAMMIGPYNFPSSSYYGSHSVNWGVAPIPTNNAGASVSLGVMDRFMCFDNDYSDAELAAVTAFFDFFFEDVRYANWVAMEGFLPVTHTGCEIMAAADLANAAWHEILNYAQFYPTSKAEWIDVKQGVIQVLQLALMGNDVQAALDELQAIYGS